MPATLAPDPSADAPASAGAPAVAPAANDSATGGRAAQASWRETLQASQALVTLSVLILATLWGAIVWQLGREREEALHNGEVELSNLARAFAEHSVKTLEGADQAVRFIRNEFMDRRADLNIASYLSDKQIIGPEYHLISVIGADGFVTHSSQPFQRVDLHDREHFRVHAQGSEDKLFVSKPVKGRVSGKWSIQLTRRIDTPEHTFGGVVVLSLSPDYFTRFYADVDLGAHGAIALVGQDGVVRARATQGNLEGAQDISASPLFTAARGRQSGVVRAVSSIDQIDRLWAFRTLDRYGLMVITGAAVDELLAEPAQRRARYLAGGGVLSVIIAAFVFGLLRRARTQIGLLRQLQLSNEQANAANRMKTRFLASVSHELRTPLNGILGYAELIRAVSQEPETCEYGEIIHTSASHLHALVNDILDLAKIESGRLEIQGADVPLTPLLTELQRAHLAHARARGLSLVLQIDPACPDTLHTDRKRVVQVLNNLLNNAVKFSETGEIRLRCSTGGGQLHIAVSDQGMGIPAERMATLFTHFQAAGHDFIHAEQGAGLGLPLSQELATLMGGRLQVVSTPGVGTTVTLVLPLRASLSRPGSRAESRAESRAATPAEAVPA